MSAHTLPAGPALDRTPAGHFLGPRLALYSACALACCAISEAGWGRSPALLPLALAAVAVAMWHGAYDPVQARSILQPRLGSRWLPVFLAGYLALAACTLAAWWLFPFVSLVLFLGYSSWHFGTEGVESLSRGSAAAGDAPSTATVTYSALAGFALGALPIAAACRLRPAQVSPVFAQMLHGPSSAASAVQLTAWLGRAFWPDVVITLLAAGMGCFGKGTLGRLGPAAVAGLTVGLFLFCNPFVAFAAYFCCWHTPAHLVATSEPCTRHETLSTNLYRNLRAGLLPWLLSLAALAVVFLVGRHALTTYQAELFIVLSALTVPHMALNELERINARTALCAHPISQKIREERP
jgi:Brp/Blh family beta-carotene 15,15'-monooxygenase